MKKDELLAAIEALLFSYGEPMTVERVAQIFEKGAKETEKILCELAENIDRRGGGVQLLRLDNAWQLASKKEYSEYIKKAFDIKRKTPLSSAALEVLAVIAYNQPVTKAFVEQVRGVDCSGVLGTLSEKGLIEERGRLELPGRPLLYGTTKNFLRCFFIEDLSELPPLPKAQVEESDVGEQLEIDDEPSSVVIEENDT